jgi:hypothetical protein
MVQIAGADALVVDLAPDGPAQWDLVSERIADDCEMSDAALGGMKDACPGPNGNGRSPKCESELDFQVRMYLWV